MRRGDGYADLSYVFEAVAEMAPHLDASNVTALIRTAREAKTPLSLI